MPNDSDNTPTPPKKTGRMLMVFLIASVGIASACGLTLRYLSGGPRAAEAAESPSTFADVYTDYPLKSPKHTPAAAPSPVAAVKRPG